MPQPQQTADDGGLVKSLLTELRRIRQAAVIRRWCIVQAVHSGSSPATIDAYIGGSTVLSTGIRYNGAVTPVVNETWALDLVNNDVVALYKVA